jgi:hypothetical protein
MTNETKQTAVDLMYQRAISVLPMGSIDARRKLKETYEQAKEMEKEQIINAYEDCSTIDGEFLSGIRYYQETFE